MKAFASLALACVAVCAFGQDEPKLPEYKLTLRPVGPPLPSFRYELVPTRDLIHVNAALLDHRALHLLADARPAGKEFFEKQQKLDEAREKPLKDFPKEEAREYLKPFNNVFKEMEAAARCDFCEWGTEQRVAAEGIGFLLPDAQKMRELALLLTLRCRLHSADGRFELALRDAGIMVMLQGFAEIVRCAVCLQTGVWPSRLKDVA